MSCHIDHRAETVSPKFIPGLWAGRRLWLALLSLLPFLSVSPVLSIPVISFQASNLPDTNPGQDLWEYTYQLSGFDFQVNQGFSVFFDSMFYANLQNPRPSSSPDWSVIALQPDTILNAPGLLDCQALVNSPSLSIPFQIDFVWMGPGAPGPQLVDIYDANFVTISSISTLAGSGGGVSTPEQPDRVLTGFLLLIFVMAAAVRPRGF